VQAPAADKQVSFLLHFTLGRPKHSLQWRFKLLQDKSVRAGLLLSQMQILEHGVQTHAAGSHPAAAAQAAEAGASRGIQEGREAHEHPKKLQIS